MVVFIFCFPIGHDALIDMKNCALITTGHVSLGSVPLGQKFSMTLMVLEIIGIGV